MSQGINFLIPEEVSNYIKLHYGNVSRIPKAYGTFCDIKKK